MIFNKDLKLFITIAINQVNLNIFKKYLITIDQTDEEYSYLIGIENSNINRNDLNILLADLCKQNSSFQLYIDSDDKYIYETYSYKNGDDFIIKDYIDDKDFEKPKDFLNQIIFHYKQEKIMLKQLTNI